MVVGCTLTSEGAQLETGVHGDHLRQDLQNLLGDGLVVNGDQVLRLGVDLEGLVEGESGLNLARACCIYYQHFIQWSLVPSPGLSAAAGVVIRTILAQSFTGSDLVHEVGLLLLKIGGEALLLGALHDLLDHLTLLSTLGLDLLLHGLGEALVVALQGFAELGIGLSLVIEVGSVG